MASENEMRRHRATLATPVLVLVSLIVLLATSCQSGRPDAGTESHPETSSHPTYRSGATTTFVPSTVSTSQASIDTADLVEIPDPLSGDNPRYPEEARALPAVGETLELEDLSTSLARVTERPGVRHEYSRFDPFNADKSMIMLMDDGFAVFRTTPPYDRQENLVRRLDLEEPRWDRTDPNLVIGFSGFQIVSLDVTTGESMTIKDFTADPTVGPLIAADPDLYHITMKDEGEVSLDGRWWALALQGTREDYRLRYLFCWDIGDDLVTGLYELPREQAGIDWVGMSSLGNWVIIGADPDNGDPLAGLVIADRGLTEFHRIAYATGHADVGLDVDGREVVVMQNSQTDYIDLIPLDPSTRPTPESGAYQGTGHVPLVRLFYASDSPNTFSCGVHISCNASGWAVVSTYQEPGEDERNWLDRSIVLVGLDPDVPQAFYLAKTYNTAVDYWEETQATLSNDGRTLVWAANFGVDPGQLKTYLVRMDL